MRIHVHQSGHIGCAAIVVAAVWHCLLYQHSSYTEECRCLSGCCWVC